MPQNIAQFDAMLSILAALGIWPVMVRLIRSGHLNPIEVRLRAIFICIFSLMVVRVPFIGYEAPAFAAATYFVAVLLAFSVFLYFETLLRRHMPLWSKIFMAVASCVLIVDICGGGFAFNHDHLKAFALFILAELAIISFLILFRKRSDYTKVENKLIGLSLLSLWLFGLFLLSDIVVFGLDWLPRLGALGVLLFAYLSLYNQALFQGQMVILRKIVKSILFSGVLLFAVERLMPNLAGDNFVHMFMLFFSVNLIFRIWYAVKDLDGEDEFYKFVRAVSESDKSNLPLFLETLASYFENLDREVLRLKDLKEYNHEGILKLFLERRTHFMVRFEIEEVLKTETQLGEDQRRIFEEIIDILDKHEMTYICMLGVKNPYLILFSVPIVGYRSMIDLKSGLIAEVARLTEGAPVVGEGAAD